MSKVLAVTTSMSTKWEAYSQTMLEMHVPEWRRVVVDGRRNWTATGFIQYVVDAEVDYIVHVDEDCFVENRDALLDLIRKFEEDPQIVAAGLPDGGYYYREHNPAALNLFFVVFRATALKLAWDDRVNWDRYKFKLEYAAGLDVQCPHLDKSRIKWDEGEPYYPLFWSLLSKGGRFLYLNEVLHRDRWSSRISLGSQKVLAEHLWYLRQWFSVQIMPGHDIENTKRYQLWQAEVHSKYRFNLRFWITLALMHSKRLLRRLRK